MALAVGGYASALGCSSAAETFDAASFFEMLRIGGSFAEAAAVAAAHLDYTAVAAGSPLLSVAFQQAGYNIYHGVGGIEAVDFSAPVAFAPLAPPTAAVPLVMSPRQWHVLTARAVSSAGIEEGNTHVATFAAADEQGVLLAPLLPAATDVTAEFLADGRVLLGFSCIPAAGLAAANAFDVLSDHGSGALDLEQPLAAVPAQAGRIDYELIVAAASLPMLLAVRSRSGESHGPLSAIVRAAAASQLAPPVTL